MHNDDGVPILMDLGIPKLISMETQRTQTGVGSVFDGSGDQGPGRLQQTGSYTLIADPREDLLPRFTFKLMNG